MLVSDLFKLLFALACFAGAVAGFAPAAVVFFFAGFALRRRGRFPRGAFSFAGGMQVSDAALVLGSALCAASFGAMWAHGMKFAFLAAMWACCLSLLFPLLMYAWVAFKYGFASLSLELPSEDVCAQSDSMICVEWIAVDLKKRREVAMGCCCVWREDLESALEKMGKSAAFAGGFDWQDAQGQTALMLATLSMVGAKPENARKALLCVEALAICGGAGKNNKVGQAALMMAAGAGSVEALKILLPCPIASRGTCLGKQLRTWHSRKEPRSRSRICGVTRPWWGICRKWADCKKRRVLGKK